MSRLSKIKAGVKHFAPVNIPGTDEYAHMVVLSSEDMVLVKKKAIAYCSGKEIGDADSFNVILNSYILYEALKVPDQHDKFFAESPEEIRELLSLSELDGLIDEHMALQEDTSKELNILSKDDLEEVKKHLETTQLNDLSGESIRALKRFLLTLEQ